MLKVVQCGADVAAHLLQIVKPNSIFDPCIHREVVECLADVGCVRLIMICDSFISTCQLAYETHQAREINIAAPNQTMFREDPWQNDCQLVIVSELAQLKNIERIVVHFLQFFLGLRRQVKHPC